MLSLDPDFLRSFLAISDTGSYGAAAESVNKTQSTVSAQMKRLEESLGVSLFEKSGRRNLLTPEGFRLLEYAKSIVRLNEEAVKAFRPATIAGTIRIGLCDDYAQAFLLPVLERFSVNYPDVEVEVFTADTPTLRARAKTEPFDALIVTIASGMDGLEPLRTDKLHWIGASDHRVHLEQRLPLALWSEGCAWRTQAVTALARANRAYRIMHTTSNGPLLQAVVKRGLAVTVGPTWYLSDGLEILEDMDRTCPLGEDRLAIKTITRTPSEPLSKFLDYIRLYFQSDGAAAGEIQAFKLHIPSQDAKIRQ